MKKLTQLMIISFVLTACERADDFGLITFQGNEISMNTEYLPFSVFYDEDIPIIAVNPLFEAVRYINSTFNIDIFLLPSKWERTAIGDIIPAYAPKGTVFVHGATDLETNDGLGETRHNIASDKKTIESADITILNSLSIDKEMYKFIIIHELGHVIGLAHDGDPCSIMYPSVNPIENEDGQLPTYFCEPEDRKFTQHDINLIRELYLKEWEMLRPVSYPCITYPIKYRKYLVIEPVRVDFGTINTCVEVDKDDDTVHIRLKKEDGMINEWITTTRTHLIPEPGDIMQIISRYAEEKVVPPVFKSIHENLGHNAYVLDKLFNEIRRLKGRELHVEYVNYTYNYPHIEIYESSYSFSLEILEYLKIKELHPKTNKQKNISTIQIHKLNKKYFII